MTFNTHWLSMARLRMTDASDVTHRAALRREASRSRVPAQPLALAEARIEGKIFGLLVTPI